MYFYHNDQEKINHSQLHLQVRQLKNLVSPKLD